MRIGPFDKSPFSFSRLSPLGTVPKKGGEGFRLIHHLSHPQGSSINDFLGDTTCKLASFDDAVRMIQQAGQGSWMWKADVKAAYRCIPVRPEDWPLLGAEWQRKLYYDCRLAFGLGTSCGLWVDYSSVVEWMARMLCFIALILHFIDDFWSVNKSERRAASDRRAFEDLCTVLGVPLAADKLEGPSQRMKFLGIVLDSVSMSASLDGERLQQIKEELRQWAARRTASIRQTQSLIGLLAFACKCVRPGRIFLHRMLMKLAEAEREKKKTVQVDEEFQADVSWWRKFVDVWNGVSLLPAQHITTAQEIGLATDACSSYGFGAICGDKWFSQAWSREQREEAGRIERESVPFMELYAIAAAAATFGSQWRGKKIKVQCDCEPVVTAVKKMSSRKKEMMRLIRVLYFIQAEKEFEMEIEHIRGEANVDADLLSRGCLQEFANRHQGEALQRVQVAALPSVSF
jgi:hypothetical protein